MLEWVSSEWKNINRDWASLFITHTHSLGHMSEREKLLGQERDCCCLEIIFMSSSFTFGVDSIFEEVVGFYSFLVSQRKKNVFIVSCVWLLCLLFSQLKILIMLAYCWKTNMVSELTLEEDIMQLRELGIPTLWIFLHRFSAKEGWISSPP